MSSEPEREEMAVVPDCEAAEENEDEVTANRAWIEGQLQASIFYTEPVRHVTYQVLHADEFGTLTHVETFVGRLSVPNAVGWLDIARAMKRTRYAPTPSPTPTPTPRAPGSEYRLKSLFVYNFHLTLTQLAAYVRNPRSPSFKFGTALSTAPRCCAFTFKPTLACFHSLNSIHIVLRRPLRAEPPPPPQ